MPARLVLFGPPAVVRDGAVIALPFERRGQLMALLALKRAWVPRAELAALLWPEQREALASTNLRKILFRLQSAPWDGLVEVQASALRCTVASDVQDFESALAEDRAGDALALRRGELLAGFDDDANEAWSAWLRFERDRLRAAWRDAALARLAADIDSGEGLELAARLQAADPLDEAALGAQMRLLAASGQAAQARCAFRDFAARLDGELGLAPGAELQALHDGLGGAAALRSAALAAPADAGFVGRTIERRHIAELLARDEVRLVTLVGPGGVGKTRLGRRLRLELAPAWGDGAFFVPLDDVTRSADIAARIAREAGLALRGSAPPLEQLGAAFGGRHMLLVLDNFEQLAGDAALLDALLAACPRIKLIVTSRVRLGLATEQLFPLEGLPCPEPEDRDSVESFDAARLFIAAAQRVEPAFIAAAEGDAIVDICRQVEGLPLALELAAAWTRVLSCAAIAAELRSGTELLRATDAAHPPRHASIEVVFEQSWQRLVPAEREALARLSVFRGGFGAEAARAVAGVALPVLGALADKSLLRRDGARLALHPLVQQLAARKLSDAPQRHRTQAAHAAYFHHRLGQLQSAVEKGERAALRAIDADLENCHLAWQHALDAGPTDVLPASTAALMNYVDHRGRIAEGWRWMAEAAQAPRVQADVGLQALLLSRAAHLAYRLDRYADAEADATRALALARRDERDAAARIQALAVLAACALRTGQLELARQRYQELLARARADGRAQSVAGTLDNLALVEKRLGNYDEALRLTHESLALQRRFGHGPGIALCLNNLGSLYTVRGEAEAAEGPLREALAICERDGLGTTVAMVRANLSQVAMQRGEWPAAQTHAERALEAAHASGNRSAWAWVRSHQARLAARAGDLAGARAMLAEGVATAITLGAPSIMAPGLIAFAELLDAQGQAQLARRVLAFSADEPTMTASDRDEMRAHLARWGGAPKTAWPGVTLPELLQRIVGEAPQAHAALIAQLN
jgi:predicted ATPase/DNA-binding SARP family transcriptional activator